MDLFCVNVLDTVYIILLSGYIYLYSPKTSFKAQSHPKKTDNSYKYNSILPTVNAVEVNCHEIDV